MNVLVFLFKWKENFKTYDRHTVIAQVFYLCEITSMIDNAMIGLNMKGY